MNPGQQLLDAVSPLDDDALVPVRMIRRHLEGEESSGPTGAGPSGEFLDVAGIAAMLDRSLSTARQLCASGEIEAFKLHGREWRATREDVRHHLKRERERHKAEAKADATGETKAPRSRRGRKLGDWRNAREDGDE